VLVHVGKKVLCLRTMHTGLKVDAAQEILTVIMTSNDKNFRLCIKDTQ